MVLSQNSHVGPEGPLWGLLFLHACSLKNHNLLKAPNEGPVVIKRGHTLKQVIVQVTNLRENCVLIL